MRISVLCHSIALTFLAIFAAPAFADDTGFASIHDMRRQGGKLCLTDHWHHGSGKGPSRKAAERDAIQSWVDFTALEYGSDWARFSKAASKKMGCSQSGAWTCSLEARPCK